jgi:hypothetical protein
VEEDQNLSSYFNHKIHISLTFAKNKRKMRQKKEKRNDGW